MLAAPMPLSEVVDRLSILSIKRRRLPNGQKRDAVLAWELALKLAWRDAGLPEPDTLSEYAALITVNEALWEVEERLRLREECDDFGRDFIDDARQVYRLNDHRARLKANLDRRLGSRLVDVKSHHSVDY